VDHGVGKEPLHRAFGPSSGLLGGGPREGESVQAGRLDRLEPFDPEEPQGFRDAVGLGVEDPGLELDADLDGGPAAPSGHGIDGFVRARTDNPRGAGGPPVTSGDGGYRRRSLPGRVRVERSSFPRGGRGGGRPLQTVAFGIWLLVGLGLPGAAGHTAVVVPLVSNAQFLGWTWLGPGAPCRGGNVIPVAHFTGNASGGTPPYVFSWNFGDGSNVTRSQNATHVFTTVGYWRDVTLTVTDAMNDSNSTTAVVWPPVLMCPALPEPTPPAPVLAGPWIPDALLVELSVPAVIAAGAVAFWLERGRRPS
jgi:PKD domain